MSSRSKSRPFVSAIVATTLDGRLRTTGGVNFPSRVDQRLLLSGRARADLVLVGGGILREENPDLGVPAHLAGRRLRLGKPAQPARCIVTHAAEFPVESLALRSDAERLIVTTGRIEPLRRAPLKNVGAEILVLGDESVDLKELFALFESRGVARIQCEAGGGLLHPLLEADLVDELLLTLCPVVSGGDFPTLADGAPFPAEALPRFSLVRTRRVGDEIFLRYRRR
ncbi:MAG: dihydrofolate reductase family protein [Chrysiogenetes bacterium]|nr:dihydrofolate reductase family protein [Chrysiogenetes bacterium]